MGGMSRRAMAQWAAGVLALHVGAFAATHRGLRTQADMVIDRERQKLYTVVENAKSVRVFGLRPLKEQPFIPLAEKPGDVQLLLDPRADRLLLYSKRTKALQILDPGKRRVVRKGHVKRPGVLRLDPSSGRIVHYSPQGLKLFDYDFRRASAFHAGGRAISQITLEGVAAIVAEAGDSEISVNLMDLNARKRVGAFRAVAPPGRLSPHVRLNKRWGVVVYEAQHGVNLVVIDRRSHDVGTLGLPMRLKAEPELDGDRYFFMSTDGHQTVIAQVNLADRTAGRVPAGAAVAFASDAGRAALYTMNADGKVRRLSIRRAKPIATFSPAP